MSRTTFGRGRPVPAIDPRGARPSQLIASVGRTVCRRTKHLGVDVAPWPQASDVGGGVAVVRVATCRAGVAWQSLEQGALEPSNNAMKRTKGGWWWGERGARPSSWCGCHRGRHEKVAPFAAYRRVGQTRRG